MNNLLQDDVTMSSCYVALVNIVILNRSLYLPVDSATVRIRPQVVSYYAPDYLHNP